MASVSPSAERNRYHHGELRQALVGAALELIAEEDVAALSLREVARRVGVTYAAPYHHFADKQALVAAVAAEGFRTLGLEMEAAQQGVEDAFDRLSAQGRVYIRFAVSHPALYRLMFQRENADPECYPELHEAADACFQNLLDSVRLALGPDADEQRVVGAAIPAWAAVHGLASLWNDGPLRHKLPEADTEFLAHAVTRTLEEGLRQA
jgi:AcrR family transcriptional regulator